MIQKEYGTVISHEGETALARFIRENPIEAWNVLVSRVNMVKNGETLRPDGLVKRCETFTGVPEVVEITVNGVALGLKHDEKLRIKYLPVGERVIFDIQAKKKALGLKRIFSDDAEVQRIREILFRDLGVEPLEESIPVIETILDVPEARPLTMADEFVYLNRIEKMQPIWYVVARENLQKKPGNNGRKRKKEMGYYNNCVLQEKGNKKREERRR
jgi:hypothetical protein